MRVFSQLAHHIFSADVVRTLTRISLKVWNAISSRMETECLRILRKIKACSAATFALENLEIVHCRICREVVVPDKSGSCSRRGCVTCHQWLLSGAERWKAESNSQNLSKDLKGCSTCYTCSLEYLELMSRQLASRMFLTNCRWSLLQRWAVPGPCGSDFKRIKLTPIAPRNANSIQHLSTVHTVPL